MRRASLKSPAPMSKMISCGSIRSRTSRYMVSSVGAHINSQFTLLVAVSDNIIQSLPGYPRLPRTNRLSANAKTKTHIPALEPNPHRIPSPNLVPELPSRRPRQPSQCSILWRWSVRFAFQSMVRLDLSLIHASFVLSFFVFLITSPYNALMSDIKVGWAIYRSYYIMVTHPRYSGHVVCHSQKVIQYVVSG